MSVRIKFCGLTRPDDVAAAESLGAAYVGAVFASGPRKQTSTSAAKLFAERTAALRVGVWGALNGDTTELAHTMTQVPLDVVQLHDDPTLADVERVRRLAASNANPLAVWAVIRIAEECVLSQSSLELFGVADAVVLDTKGSSHLGGTGLSFDWETIAREIVPHRGKTMLVVAGGLTPDNVADAIQVLHPDVVDVSSGVESAPGIKDHHRMRRFVEAVRNV